jgi:hypothetical protein
MHYDVQESNCDIQLNIGHQEVNKDHSCTSKSVSLKANSPGVVIG